MVQPCHPAPVGYAIHCNSAESDPANAEWQHDLAGSYERIANASESSSVANEYLVRCLQTLEHMRNSGMHLDPDTLRFYQQLAERITNREEFEPRLCVR